MSNPSKNGKEIALPKPEPTSPSKITDISTSVINEPIITPIVATQIPNKNLQTVFENLKKINVKKEHYEEFSEKLDSVLEFRNKHDGSGLNCVINNQDGKSITITKLDLILDFVDKVIEVGKEYKTKFEYEILNAAL